MESDDERFVVTTFLKVLPLRLTQTVSIILTLRRFSTEPHFTLLCRLTFSTWKVVAFQDVGVEVEPILILVSCRLSIGAVCLADSKINPHVPQLFYSTDLEPETKTSRDPHRLIWCNVYISVVKEDRGCTFLGFRKVLFTITTTIHHRANRNRLDGVCVLV